MPSLITHSFVAVIAGNIFPGKRMPARFFVIALVCSVIPDADVVAFHFHIPYGHPFGHRGFFHSLFFALLLSLLIVAVFFRDRERFGSPWRYVLCFFLLTASHGLLDALTNGGMGVALLAPFDNTRYFFPWTPVKVSPIGIHAFLSKRGLDVIISEALWIWLPLMTFAVALRIGRSFGNGDGRERRTRRRTKRSR